MAEQLTRTAPRPELALRALVEGLPGELDTCPERLYAQLCDLIAALTRGRLRDELRDRKNDSDATLRALRRGAPLARHSRETAWSRLLALGGDEAQTSTLPPLEAARVADCVDALFFHDEQPIEYSQLGIEQLGAVYEELLAFRVLKTTSPSVCLKPHRVWIDLGELVAMMPAQRGKWLQRRARLGKQWLLRHAAVISQARSASELEAALSSQFVATSAKARPGQWLVQPGLVRRRTGAHYTPSELCRNVVERSLAPLLAARNSSRELLQIRICDPAMGCGVFLLEACRQLGTRLFELWRSEGQADATLEDALRAVASQCLYGVDINATAVNVARLSLEALTCLVDDSQLRAHLRHGDALLGIDARQLAPEGEVEWSGTPRQRLAHADHFIARALKGPHRARTPGRPDPERAEAPARQHHVFHWPLEFDEVFSRPNPGFDACLGNPPWVAFVGRAAQPLDPDLARYYARTFDGFRRYKTLHGLFASRAARLLRRGGRLGLVLPTSVADLDGYEPSRAAHDQLCATDVPLPDFGDGAFPGVFQPCMALLSTRRRADRHSQDRAVSWPLERPDLDQLEMSLLNRLDELEKLPPELFGERGLQTSGADLQHFQSGPGASLRAVHEGADVGEFQLSPPQLFVDPTKINGRFRSAREWRDVALLIRQTARFPIAQLSDGEAFRNSLLAAFRHDRYRPHLLLGYLNSSLARWFHYQRHRDARQGMPQLKIGHLRALPAIPLSGQRQKQLEHLAARLGQRNAGLSSSDRSQLDRLVFAAFDLSGTESDRVARWAESCPPPKRRSRIAA